MNIEFHYYITKYLAIKAGFDKGESEIIAYSSQLVDDNSFQFSIETPEGTAYENYISQTKNITKPLKKLMRIYLLFHFLPGNPTSSKVRRLDGKMHLLMTSPASSYSQEIFFESTKNDNLFSLGIASHMLADTFSHQNFVGTFDEINALKGVWETLMPNIGHADAGYKPDIPNLIWFDPRLIEENQTINNKERVLFAAKKLYSNYLFLTSFPNNWSEVKQNISDIIGDSITETQLPLAKKQQNERIEKFKSLFNELETEAEYDKYSWFSKAVKQKIKLFDDKKFKIDPVKDKFSFKENYEKSDWYNFQEAVKIYQKSTTSKLAPLLAQIEIREW